MDTMRGCVNVDDVMAVPTFKNAPISVDAVICRAPLSHTPPPPPRQLNVTGGQHLTTRFYNKLRGFSSYFSLRNFTKNQYISTLIPRGGRISATLNARCLPLQKRRPHEFVKTTLYHHIQRILR
jgi:hypothetical protein